MRAAPPGRRQRTRWCRERSGFALRDPTAHLTSSKPSPQQSTAPNGRADDGPLLRSALDNCLTASLQVLAQRHASTDVGA